VTPASRPSPAWQPQLSRHISRVGSEMSRSAGSSRLTMEYSTSNAVSPSSPIGCRTEVSCGCMCLVIGMSSKPVTATWLGTSTPHLRSA